MKKFGVDSSKSLAISLTTAPGKYALLRGSGVSHAVGIPTGWEITLGLVRSGDGGVDALRSPQVGGGSHAAREEGRALLQQPGHLSETVTL